MALNNTQGKGWDAHAGLRRLNEDWAKKCITAQGFVFEKSYDGQRNPAAPLDKMVYDEAVTGETDRYVHLYRLELV